MKKHSFFVFASILMSLTMNSAVFAEDEVSSTDSQEIVETSSNDSAEERS